jgi:menaquinone-dependent protoporphyrinogen IX oxidase
VKQNVLLVYFSLTGQTRFAVKRAAAALQATSHRVTECRIRFSTEEHTFPLRPLDKEIRTLGAMARKGVANITFDEDVANTDYDLVIIFSPTWSFSPAAPVSAFLKSAAAHEILSGTPFAVSVVCRGFWRRNARITRALGERAGGQWLGSAGFTFDGNYLQTNHAFFAYHVHAGDMSRKLLKLNPTPYGLSEATLRRVEEHARAMASLVKGDHPPNARAPQEHGQ